jgi:hypothetical protein
LLEVDEVDAFGGVDVIAWAGIAVEKGMVLDLVEAMHEFAEFNGQGCGVVTPKSVANFRKDSTSCKVGPDQRGSNPASAGPVTACSRASAEA